MIHWEAYAVKPDGLSLSLADPEMRHHRHGQGKRPHDAYQETQNQSQRLAD